MFEPEACVPLRLVSRPQVGVGALSALRRLLAEVSGRVPADASASAAEGDSPDQIGERSMRRRRDRRRGTPGSRVPQSDLFAPLRAESGPAGAVWPALSEGTQQALMSLLARLILEHEAKAGCGGGRHER
jgi:hypothetical protein